MNNEPPKMPEEPLLLTGPEEPLLLPAPEPPPGDPLRNAGQAGNATNDGERTAANAHSRLPYVVAALALLVLLLIGWFFHHRQASAAKEANRRARDRLPTVGAIEVEQSASATDLLLPGSIAPITEASLFARSSGYLRARYVDIGDTVRRGQVLAEIDSPDLDQQVAQGRASVAQARQQLAQAAGTVADARARVDLARVTYERVAVLGRSDAVSRQEVDQRRQELDTAQAALASNLANVAGARDNIRASEAGAQRLVVLQEFEKLRAPFDGVVTARSVDVGALIGSGGASMGPSGQPSNASSSGGTSGSGSSSTGASSTGSGGSPGGATGGGQTGELFRIGQVDRLRVFVSVPQENAAGVGVDGAASVFVQGYPDAVVGRVTRNAKSLDPSARTLLTEVQIDNARHVLMPGMYAQVRFHSARGTAPLLVPGEAVIARADGLSIAVLEALRPEDRERLPKRSPDDGAKKDGKDDPKDAGGAAASGDSRDKKDAKQEVGPAGKGRTKKGEAEEAKKGDDGKQDERPRDPDEARRIHLQRVTTGRDYGTEIEIVQGLSAGALIVANPGDDVVENALVLPKRRSTSKPSSGKSVDDAPPAGNASPSRTAPTKGRS